MEPKEVHSIRSPGKVSMLRLALKPRKECRRREGEGMEEGSNRFMGPQ